MAQQEFYTILTTAGLAYEANRKALGLPIKLSEMSVGDGNGSVYNPDATQTALRREVWRGPINALLQDENNPTWLVGELTLPDDVGGWVVREVGFWTDSGILYAVGKYPESLKPLLATGAGKEFYIRAIFQTSNAESVVLVVDDNVVKATRAFVLDSIASELAKLDVKRSVRVATTGPVVLSGAQLVDAVAVIAGDRVLVKDQADQKANGIYVVANGAWVRATDADASVEVTPGIFVHIETGLINADSWWHLVTNGPVVLGATPLAFECFAGPTGVAPGEYNKVTVDRYGRVTGGTSLPAMAALSRVIAIAASTNLAPNQMGLVLADASAGGLVVTLPVANGALGIVDVIIRRTDATGNSLSIAPSGTDKIMLDTGAVPAGLGSWSLAFSGEWLHLRADASGRWWVVGQSVLPATESRKGVVQFADIATALQGLSTQLAIHPAALKAFLGVLPFSREYVSPELSFTAAGPVGPIAHDLEGQHRLAVIEMINQEADAGFVPGESYFMVNGYSFQASEGLAVKSTESQWSGRWGSSRIASCINIMTGGVINMTGNRWKSKVRLYR